MYKRLATQAPCISPSCCQKHIIQSDNATLPRNCNYKSRQVTIVSIGICEKAAISLHLIALQRNAAELVADTVVEGRRRFPYYRKE